MNGDPGLPKLHVVAHLHYEHLLSPLLEQLANIPDDLPYMLTLTYSGRSPAFLASARAQPQVTEVHRVPNQGRDVGPFLELVRRGVLQPTGPVLKLHGKRSPHRADGDAWRRALWHGVLPSGDVARKSYQLLVNELCPTVLAPSQAWVTSGPEDCNYPRIKKVLSGHVELATHFTYAAGSTFWSNAAFIARLRHLSLGINDFEREAGQLDGTLAHAMERAFGVIADQRWNVPQR